MNTQNNSNLTEALRLIDNTVKHNDVVLYMKGNRLAPQCGFSGMAISILETCGVQYLEIDVLESDEIRAAIKEYGEWPTIPQLYVQGELIGGSDIMKELYESGEMEEIFSKL